MAYYHCKWSSISKWIKGNWNWTDRGGTWTFFLPNLWQAMIWSGWTKRIQRITRYVYISRPNKNGRRCLCGQPGESSFLLEGRTRYNRLNQIDNHVSKEEDLGGPLYFFRGEKKYFWVGRTCLSPSFQSEYFDIAVATGQQQQVKERKNSVCCYRRQSSRDIEGGSSL